MPPRIRITGDMIIDAAIAVVRQSGYENVNARTVAGQLKCSTQPVMYHFATIDSLKRAAYAQADQEHTAYLMDIPPGQLPILGIGLNYIRYAVERPHLFRFLFQSGYTEEKSLLDMADSEDLLPVLGAMQAELGMSMEKTKGVFVTVALFAHGLASIIANNGLSYDEGLSLKTDADLNVVHFKEEAPQIFKPGTLENNEQVEGLSFTTDSFSSWLVS